MIYGQCIMHIFEKKLPKKSPKPLAYANSNRNYEKNHPQLITQYPYCW